MLKHSRRRRDEHGQVLAIALAFIAFFAVVTVAVLSYASAIARQHVSTETTARTDSLAEGGAAWAAADAATGTLGCTPGATGFLAMEGGATVTYSISHCPTGTGAGQPPGHYCQLCLMAPVSSCSPSVKGAALQLSGGSQLNITGEIDSNGSIWTESKSSTVTAKQISLVSGVPVCQGKNKLTLGSCFCVPNPTTPFSTAIVDPLAYLPAPTPSGSPQSVVYSNSTRSLSPGIYSGIDVSKSAQVTLNSGVYILTGTLSVADSASITSSGPVVIYLACPAASAPWVKPCATKESGGSITVGGSASLAVTGGNGSYSGVSVFSDPNLADPSPAQVISIEGSGTMDSGTGAVDVPSGTVSNEGSGSLAIGSRLVAAYLTGSGSGAANFTEPPPTPPACPVFDFGVSGTSGSSSGPGRAIVQSNCNGHTGIVGFSYQP
jgi:hypothetical protein